MNRGNRRAVVFHNESDYEDFVHLMLRANERVPMRVLSWCLMPNHFHLVLWPRGETDLSRWMHWLMTSHVQRYRRRHGTNGRIWQGRFKAPPVQQDRHLLIVMRYGERNPLRAGLVSTAEEWRWSSLRARVHAPDGLVSPSPVPLGEDWCDRVNQPLTASELEAVRTCTDRGRPFGDPAWTRGTAERLGLLASLNPRGRPKTREP